MGTVLIIISAIAFGSMTTLAHFAYADGTNAITMLFLRFSIAAICMNGLLVYRRIPYPRGPVVLRLVALGGILYTGQALAYFSAVDYAPVSLLGLLLYIYPAIVAVLAVVFLRERITPIKGLALVLALVGSVLTVGGNASGGQPLGVALGLLAACMYSIYILLVSHTVTQVKPFPASTVIVTSTALTYALLVGGLGAKWPQTSAGWFTVLALGLVSAVAILTFYAGIDHVGPTTASILSAVEPVTTVLLAALVLHDPITLLQIAGGSLILLAVALLARTPHKDAQASLT